MTQVLEENNKITYRIASLDDIDQVSQLETKTFSLPWSREAFAEVICSDSELLMIATDGDKHIGTCVVLAVLDEATICNVVVDEEYRNKGIAYGLIDMAMQEATRLFGVNAYTLEVRTSNEAAIKLYKKLGFVSEGIRPRFYEKPTEDALIMWRRV